MKWTPLSMREAFFCLRDPTGYPVLVTPISDPLSGCLPFGGPERTCVGCRSKRPAGELIRIGTDPVTRQPILWPGSGRSAYLCPEERCLEQALKKGAISRALRIQPSADGMRDLAEAIRCKLR